MGSILAATDVTDKGLFDALSRPLRDLRISVTDRCNFRCSYCMPKETNEKNVVFLGRDELLSFEEIYRVARLAVGLGVRKIRITGGEPLLRNRLAHLIERLALLKDASGQPIEIAMTTNGTQLAARARVLREAGLSRLTVSLDALDDGIFRQMTGSEIPVRRVLDGIEAAQNTGYSSVKVNAVIRRGVNESEIIPLVRQFRNTGVVLRFIEFMDVGTTNRWQMEDVVTSREILHRVDAVFPLLPLAANYPGEVAKRWRFVDGAGEIGVVDSVTHAFCHECTRLRLSTDGKLFGCLFASQGEDLRTLLRGNAGDVELARRISSVWLRRQDRYSEQRQNPLFRLRPGRSERIEMSYIGG